jgi:hypothetical protein
METENITNAIEGLATYMDAIARMNQQEFDYCYNKLVKEGMDHWRIERYLNALMSGK